MLPFAKCALQSWRAAKQIIIKTNEMLIKTIRQIIIRTNIRTKDKYTVKRAREKQLIIKTNTKT